jgi:hypothetical protein
VIETADDRNNQSVGSTAEWLATTCGSIGIFA